uniref:Uncharacterized protein n=1 Tax=Glossina brevipalpis TaxID=37001 RepID=A0A1A9WRT9_9MUSC
MTLVSYVFGLIENYLCVLSKLNVCRRCETIYPAVDTELSSRVGSYLEQLPFLTTLLASDASLSRYHLCRAFHKTSNNDKRVRGVPGVRSVPGVRKVQGMRVVPGLRRVPGVRKAQGMRGVPGLRSVPGVRKAQGMRGVPGLRRVPGLRGVPGLRRVPGRITKIA